MTNSPESGEAPAADPALTSDRQNWAGLLGAIALAGLILAIPQPAGLSAPGQRLAAVFAGAIVLWVTEALPIGVTALIVLLLQPLLGIEVLGTAFHAFASPVFFFVLAMLLLAQAVIGSKLDRRFAYWLLDRAGTESRRVVIALICGAAALSTIMSDVPACAIFMAIGMGVLTRSGVSPGESNFGKAVMVGIPIGSLIGGVATPAGSSINVLGMHFIEEYGGVTLTFLDWTMLGVPMVLMLVPIACWVILQVFPPEQEHIVGHDAIAAEHAALGPLTLVERKAIALVGTMLVLWVLGTWEPRLNVVVVALAGAIAIFLPGMRLLRWREAERGIAWETLLMIGGVTSIGSASVETGLAEWVVHGSLGGLQAWPTAAVIAAISAFTVLVHLVIPIGPVINGILIPPIVLLANEAGVHPALYALPVAFSASASFLLPLDPVPLLTYSKGYYRMLDMLGPGLILGAFWVVCMTLLTLMLGPALGIG